MLSAFEGVDCVRPFDEPVHNAYVSPPVEPLAEAAQIAVELNEQPPVVDAFSALPPVDAVSALHPVDAACAAELRIDPFGCEKIPWFDALALLPAVQHEERLPSYHLACSQRHET